MRLRTPLGPLESRGSLWFSFALLTAVLSSPVSRQRAGGVPRAFVLFTVPGASPLLYCKL